jgi:hypothetical protein
MSDQRDKFEQEVRNSEAQAYSQDRWELAIDILNSLSMYEMLRTLYNLKPLKRQEVLDAAKFILTVKRQWQDPYDRIAWAAQIATEVRFVAPRANLFVTPPNFPDPPEVVDAKVFVAEKTVGGGGNKNDFIMLAQPSLAFNAAGLPVRYQMDTTTPVASGATFSSLIAAAAAKGKLKHLIFNCHGEVDKASGAVKLLLGTGATSANNADFSKLSGNVGVIWICGCLAANSTPGLADCRERAKNAGAYLVAPAWLMTAGGGDLPKGHMDMNARFMPHVFTPTGGDMTWGGFLAMGPTLGLTPHFR